MLSPGGAGSSRSRSQPYRRCLSILPWDALAAIKSFSGAPGRHLPDCRRWPGQKKAVIGFLIGQLAADEAEILSDWRVAPTGSASGLATGLLEGLMRAARRGGAKRIFLEVAEDNAAGLALLP